MKLANKIALVTGGSSGMGLATAKLFQQEGATLIVTARTDASFETAFRELGRDFHIIKCDVSKPEELAAMYSEIKQNYGGLDILFANAGVAGFKPTIEVDEAYFDRQADTNIRGLFFTVAKAIPLLRKNSRVLLNASIIANKGFAGGAVYAATKAAVRSFARSWTAEFHPDDICFNVISPGAIETPLYDKMGMTEAETKDFHAYLKTVIPAKRFGSVDEVAKAALFLCSEQASFISGIDLMIDGGFAQV